MRGKTPGLLYLHLIFLFAFASTGEAQKASPIPGGALDSAEGAPGPIMLQGDHGKVWFRNIVLTPAK